LIGLPVHLASYRERGVLRRFQAARMPARVSYHVHWPVSWWGMGLAMILGTMTFAAIGVFLGAVLPTARAAQGVGVLLWFLVRRRD
jgi:ABC-2 type transport system permease protein